MRWCVVKNTGYFVGVCCCSW